MHCYPLTSKMLPVFTNVSRSGTFGGKQFVVRCHVTMNQPMNARFVLIKTPTHLVLQISSSQQTKVCSKRTLQESSVIKKTVSNQFFPVFCLLVPVQIAVSVFIMF